MGILAPLDSCNQLGPVKVQRECFRYGLAACIRRFKFLFSLVADGHVIRVNGFIAGLLRFVFLHVPLIRKEADLPFSLLPFFLNKMEPPNGIKCFFLTTLSRQTAILVQEQRKQHRKTKEKLDGFVCCVKEDWTGTPLVHLVRCIPLYILHFWRMQLLYVTRIVS